MSLVLSFHLNLTLHLKMSVRVDVLLFFCALFAVALSDEGKVPKIKLNDGGEMPQFGLGTWLGGLNPAEKAKRDEVIKAVEWAIDAGYTHIDTAAIYHTEEQVGKAVKNKIAEGKIKREDIFITTKLWNTDHAPESVIPALNKSLEKLGMQYVDLYLIHWPIASETDEKNKEKYPTIDYVDTWKAMIEAKSRGLAKSIGVSNFNREQIDRVIAATNVTPAVLQIELNLNLQQPTLLAYCKEKNIAVTAYTPFGSLFPSKAAKDAPPPRVDDPVLLAIANKYNKTTTQVNLRYLVELGTVPIPKSVTQKRIEENFDIFDFTLTNEDKEKLKSFDKHYRSIFPKWWAETPYYPFNKD